MANMDGPGPVHLLPGTVLLAVLLVAILVAPALAARPQGEPAIEWEQLYGGSARDEMSTVALTADGGYVAVGTSWSNWSGDVQEGTHGGFGDVWVVKVSPAGALEWQTLLGGDAEDRGVSVRQTLDGGYVLLGYSGSSQNGDVQSTTSGPRDLWVVRLSAAGAVEWEQLIGGSDDEYAADIEQAPSGAYVILGTSRSPPGGIVTGGTHGGYDAWLVALDDTGTYQFQVALGGAGEEIGRDLQYVPGGGWIVLAETTSVEGGQVEGTPRGGRDLWVLRLDGGLSVVWQRRLGGAGDERAGGASPTADGGFVVVGSTDSDRTGDVQAVPNHGEIDVWAVKLGASGATEWERLYGGSSFERGYTVRETGDGGCILLGESWSVESGDVTGTNHGAQNSVSPDAWLVALNATGGIAWQRLVGGSLGDTGSSLQATAGGGLVMGGWSYSNASWDVWDMNNGESDYWLVRMDPVLAVPGATAPPGDTNRDGLFEDVNGNGRADFADVVLFFNQMGPIGADEPARAFDFNRNGRIDFADVVWLFTHL